MANNPFVQNEGVHGVLVKPKFSWPLILTVSCVTIFTTVLIIIYPNLFLDPRNVLDMLLGIFTVGLLALYIVLLINKKVFNGAPYVRTHPKTLSRMLALADIKPGDVAIDLGSGDGEIVLACAKSGAMAYGFEINPLLCLWSKFRIYRSGLSKNTFISKNSFWNIHFGDYDVVTVFGIGYMMPSLEKKLQGELKSGAKVISNSFMFPNWKFVKQDKDVYLYIKD